MTDESESEEEKDPGLSGRYDQPSGTGIISILLFLIPIVVFGWLAYASLVEGNLFWAAIYFFVAIFLGFFLSSTVKINNQWENAVILRLGKYSRFKGPGLFFIIPFIEDIIRRDMRVRTTTFTAEQTLTKDNVPVNVDAVLFWQVMDAMKSVTAIQDYYGSIVKASMTTLRDIIGQTDLATMLSDRAQIDVKLKDVIEKKAKAWGLDVNSVEIRDIRIPAELQDAMSRKAQAEKEKLARVELADSEVQIAKKFKDAAAIYELNPEAMKLRAMNMLYESVKEKGSFIIVPSDVVNTMGYSGTLGAVAFAQQQQDKRKESAKKK